MFKLLQVPLFSLEWLNDIFKNIKWVENIEKYFFNILEYIAQTVIRSNWKMMTVGWSLEEASKLKRQKQKHICLTYEANYIGER